jgi:hypothetical protein
MSSAPVMRCSTTTSDVRSSQESNSVNENRYHLTIGGQTRDGLTHADVRAILANDPAGARTALLWTDGWSEWRPVSTALAPPDGASTLLRIINFVPDFLSATDSGEAFRRTGATLLRVLAVLTGVVGLIWWVFAWRTIFDATPRGVVAGILPQFLIAITLAIVVRIFWLRAGQLSRLPAGPWMATRACGQIFRACGDAGLFYWSMQGAAFLTLVLIGGVESPIIKWTVRFRWSGSDYAELVAGSAAEFGASVGMSVLFWLAAHLVADLMTAAVPVRVLSVVRSQLLRWASPRLYWLPWSHSP